MDEPARKRAQISFDVDNKILSLNGRLPALSTLTPFLKAVPAPHQVRAKFGGLLLFIGIDIETHALAPRSASYEGRTDTFGLWTLTTEEGLSFLRMIQLGWAFSNNADMVIKTKLIKPIDFTIETSATKLHHITHEEACEHGVQIQDALQQLFDDVTTLVGKGCRLCAHQLSFDAGIILQEFDRAGLYSCKAEWVSMVRDDLCTMDLDICHWIRQQATHRN